ncbi:MAG: hypothetical protein ACKVIH_01730 [Burkholderiales bacterium]
MKGLVGLIGLLLALAVGGFVVKKQLASTVQPIPTLNLPTPSGAAPQPADAPAALPLTVPGQYKQAVEGVLQQARPLPDDK